MEVLALAVGVGGGRPEAVNGPGLAFVGSQILFAAPVELADGAWPLLLGGG